MCVNGLDRRLPQEFDRGAEAGEAGDVVNSRLVFGRQLIGLAVLVALRSGAAAPQRSQFAFHARANVQHSRACRSEQPFMAWRG
jgi:hypothetical protein